MEKNAFVSLYEKDPFVQTIAQNILKDKSGNHQIKGLSGSLDSLLFSVLFKSLAGSHLIVAHDKEEAAYINNDLQELLGEGTIFFFPSSYKRPYQYDEVENANVLQRAEILNKLLAREVQNPIIITYAEALYERVINKRSLTENTFKAAVGEKVDLAFISELLSTYDFEKTDFG